VNTTDARHQQIVVMTGDDLRHQYFIKQLSAKFHIAAIFIESYDYPSPLAETEEENEAWNWFFGRRNLFEEKFIPQKQNTTSKNKPDICYLKKNELNSPNTLSLLKNKYSPGFIAAFGTGIMKENFLSLYPNSIYNMHLGIPEFYRGSSCNFWPIHNSDLKNLGATIHRVENGIDTGEIAAEEFVRLESTDNEQTLLWKTIQTGTRLMIKTIEEWKLGTLNLKKQKQAGKLYKMNDFTPAAILRVKKMMESGELKSQIELTMADPINPI